MNDISFEKTPAGTTTTIPDEDTATTFGGAASFASAESIEILNLLGNDADGGSCCGGGCCSSE